MKKSLLITFSLVIASAIVAAILYTNQSKMIVIESDKRNVKSLRVVVFNNNGSDSKYTDDNGVTIWGTGPWVTPFTKNRSMILAVFEGDNIVWEGMCQMPAMGTIKLNLEKDYSDITGQTIPLVQDL